MVPADPTQIYQLLMHLGANAEYAMRKSGGVLEVRLEAVELDAVAAAVHPDLVPGPYVRLTVQDTGHGMSPAVTERIFEPFFTTKEIGEATGMGLAVVHGIVMNHNGVIMVHSIPGRGTAFVIYLPCLSQAALEDGAMLEPIARDRGQILFVDDEESMVRL